MGRNAAQSLDNAPVNAYYLIITPLFASAAGCEAAYYGRLQLYVWIMPMLTNFYIDGFNLYNGSLKGTSYKWLDFSALFRNLFPNAQIRRIRYFTALVKATPNDPQKRQRQQIYIRAIKTIPSLSVHLTWDAFRQTLRGCL